jgi:hypothetical protein
MSGLKMAALYGIYPHQLGFCGPEKESKLLLDYLRGKKVSQKEVREILKQFEGAYSYYKRIAKDNKIKDVFDQKVVKAYWIGNNLLKKAPQAHHSFHVFIVGSVTGRIELKGKLLDICRISWGKVIKKGRNKVIIKYQPIKKVKGKYILADFTEKNILWDKELVPGIKIGDTVSCHWNHLIQVLNNQDVANLKKYTNLTLRCIIKE